MSKRVSIVEVILRKGESQEKLVKRFFKKCKKVEVVREYLDKTSYFKSKREKRREKSERNKWLKNKYKFQKK